MRKKVLANHYMHEITYGKYDNMDAGNDAGDGKFKICAYRYARSSDLFVNRNNRFYKTKMKYTDLPNTYCQVSWIYNHVHFFNTVGVKSIKYRWMRENHWMKDSVLIFDYTGNMKCKDGANGRCISDYDNVDGMIWGNDILRFLAYIHKYSNYDLGEVRKDFIEQINWLQENEPDFAPTTGDAGEWFDNTISEYTPLNMNENF